MDNASDALIMAGNVLIFILALTFCISSFSKLRSGIDSIYGEAETIQMAKDTDGYINYMQSRNNGAIRVVGAETVVTSMLRSIKENYVIYIKLNNTSSLSTGSIKTIKFIEATKQIKIVNQNNELQTAIDMRDKLMEITIGTDKNQKVNEILSNGFYKDIQGKNFFEYIGEYEDDNEANSEDKATKRIITYIETQT